MRISSFILSFLLAGSVFGTSVEPSVTRPLSMKDTVVAPRPQPPYEARARHITGFGICVLQVRPDGTVSDATMVRSTGSAILDNATVSTFHRWRFVPGRADEVKIPIKYNSYDVELLSPSYTAAGARTTFGQGRTYIDGRLPAASIEIRASERPITSRPWQLPKPGDPLYDAKKEAEIRDNPHSHLARVFERGVFKGYSSVTTAVATQPIKSDKSH
jgi:TonB family protein